MRRAAVAQLSSNLWTVAIGLVFVPVYIRFLGIEAYGLLGLYAALQGLASVLDLGLTTTVNREPWQHEGGRSCKSTTQGVGRSRRSWPLIAPPTLAAKDLAGTPLAECETLD